MSGFITALTGTGGISSSSLWTDVTAAAPLLLIIVPFVFGFTVVKRIIKGTAKGKVRM